MADGIPVEYLNTFPDHELARKILAICHKSAEDINKSWESNWTHVYCEAIDDIALLCKETLGEK